MYTLKCHLTVFPQGLGFAQLEIALSNMIILQMCPLSYYLLPL